MKIKQGTVIGIAGVAGAGKDLLFESISENPLFGRVKKVSLAQELKNNIAPTIKDHYGIDITTCSRKDKNLVRPMMVAHGTIMRKKTNGRYWIEKVSPIIENLRSNKEVNTICITDIRYDEYPKDEVSWLIEEMGGYLIHLSKFKMSEGGGTAFHPPVNSDEAINDPRLQNKSDLEIRWEECETEVAKSVMKKKISRKVHDWMFMKADANRRNKIKSELNYFSE